MKLFKKLLYAFIGLVALLCFLGILSLIIVPRIINSEEVKARVESQFKAKTGGNVAYQKLGFSFFPFPHVSVDDIKISMPEVFAGEVAKTNIYPEILPLLKGNVDISAVEMVAPDISLYLISQQKQQEDKTTLDAVFAQLPPQLKIRIEDGNFAIAKDAGEPLQIKDIDAVIAAKKMGIKYKLICSATAWKKLYAKGNIDLQTLHGKGEVSLEEFQPGQIVDTFFPQTTALIDEAVVNLDIVYDLAGKDNLDVSISGSLPHLTLLHNAKKMTFREGRFSSFIQHKNELTAIHLQKLTTDYPGGALSGQLMIDQQRPQVKLELAAENQQVKAVREIGLLYSSEKSLVYDIFYPFRGGEIPEANFSVTGATFDDLIVFDNMNIMLFLREGRVALIEDGVDDVTDLNGDIHIKDGDLAIQNIKAKTGKSVLSARQVDLTFGEPPKIKITNGQASLFAEDIYPFAIKYGLLEDSGMVVDKAQGQISLAELDIAGPLLRPMEWKIYTRGEMNNVSVTSPVLREPIEVKKGNFLSKWDKDAKKNKTEIQELTAVLGENKISVSGIVKHSTQGANFDLQLEADGIDANLLTIQEQDEETQQTDQYESFWDAPLSGRLHVTSDYVLFDKYTFNDAGAVLLLEPDKIEAQNAAANLCGIALNGAMHALPQNISFSLKPAVHEQDIEAALLCLFGDRARFSGKYNLESEFAGKGQTSELMDNLEGRFTLDVAGGRVFRSPLLFRIFSLLRVVDVFKGQLPDFSDKGFSYKYIKGQADVKGPRIIVNEVVFESKTINLAGYGEIDVQKEKMDLVILVTTLSTVKSVIEKIPIIKDIAGGDLLTYPVKVSGSIHDPKVNFLSPTQLGKKAIGIVERTLKLPGKIIKPVIPDFNKK